MEPSADKPRFFCDTMLGRLAKWLRLMGYHAAYQNEIDDWDMLQLCSRNRLILLTRDGKVMDRWQIGKGMVKALQVKSNDYREQLKQVREYFNIEPRRESLCPVCNLELDPLSREEARERVPPHVYATQFDYRSCPSCRRVYWKATHWQRIESIFSGPLS